MTTYGLTPQGFVAKQQATIIDEIQQALQLAFGTSINLLPRSRFSQIVGTLSEREALLWQLAEAVYASQYPTGAEGTSVDNILALNNLRRLAAVPTKTAPTDTDGVPGFVLSGVPGTVVTAGSIILVNGNAVLQFTLDADVTITAAVNAIQQMTFFGGVPTQGTFTLAIEDPAGNTLTTEALYFDALGSGSKLIWRNSSNVLTPPSAGAFVLTMTRAGVTSSTSSLSYTASAAAIQTAVQLLPAYSTVTVTAVTGGFQFNWGGLSEPKLGITSSTLIFPFGGEAVFVDSIQAAINTLQDVTAGNYPYTDVVCSGSIAGALVNFIFGDGVVVAGQPVSAAQAQSLLTAPSSTLQDGSVVVNINIVTQTPGTPAQGIGAATCTTTGPNFVPAGFLATIGSPISGWTSVTNPLDCITGRNQETDPEALARRATLLAAQANGPIQAIAEKVSLVPNVIQAVGFENTSNAAEQNIAFAGTPTSGYFVMRLYGLGGFPVNTAQIPWNAQATTQKINFSATPSAGTWTITLGLQTTAAIQFNATASAIQAAIRLLDGFDTVVVTGNYGTGFSVAFGLMPQLPITVNTGSLTGATAAVITSIQSIINAIPQYAQLLLIGSYAVGLTVMFNGSVGGQPQPLIGIPDNSLAGVSSIVATYGRPGNSFEIVVNDNNGQADDIAIATAIFKSKPAGIQSFGNTGPIVMMDTADNSYPVYFSRPVQIPIYIVINLQTDLTTNPSPQFNIGSIPTIQANLVAIGNAFKAGGVIVGFGTGGLVGGFNSIPGINSYSMFFGTSSNPTSNANIQLGAEQVGLFETFLIVVSYD